VKLNIGSKRNQKKIFTNISLYDMLFDLNFVVSQILVLSFCQILLDRSVKFDMKIQLE